MDFTFSPEDQRLIERAKSLAAEFASRTRQYDETASFPEEDFARLREEGFLKLTVPEEYGGHGMWDGNRYTVFYAILETIAAGSSATAQLLQVHSHAVGIIAKLGNEEQKRRILGDVVERGALAASCGSEANPRQLATTAGSRAEMELVDGGFRVNCTKHFASLAPAADYYLVWLTAPGAQGSADGLTMVVVPKGTPGVSLEDNWDVMGMRATISWALVLKDVFVPWENVLGQPGDWVQYDPRTFTLAYCANHLGSAQGVFNFVIEYLKQRPFLLQDDTITYTVGEMDAWLQATRTSLWYAAWLYEQGRYDEAELAALRTLHTAKQVGLMVTSKAFDVCGARAAFRHLPVERAFRDVRTFTLHERESAVLRIVTETNVGEPFHSKQRYGPKLGRQSWESLGITPPATVG